MISTLCMMPRESEVLTYKYDRRPFNALLVEAQG